MSFDNWSYSNGKVAMSRPQRVPECNWRFQLGNALLLHIIEIFSFWFLSPPPPNNSGCWGKRNQEQKNRRFFLTWATRNQITSGSVLFGKKDPGSKEFPIFENKFRIKEPSVPDIWKWLVWCLRDSTLESLTPKCECTL